MSRDEKFWSKTERAERDDLNSSGPPRPGSGYDVPPEPPSRRPWIQVIRPSEMARRGQVDDLLI